MIDSIRFEAKNVFVELFQVVYGTATARARWRECEDYVTGQMGMAVGQKFVKQEFDETAKGSVS